VKPLNGKAEFQRGSDNGSLMNQSQVNLFNSKSRCGGVPNQRTNYIFLLITREADHRKILHLSTGNLNGPPLPFRRPSKKAEAAHQHTAPATMILVVKPQAQTARPKCHTGLRPGTLQAVPSGNIVNGPGVT
jgi:hypothetical protein